MGANQVTEVRWGNCPKRRQRYPDNRKNRKMGTESEDLR